jgi:hypothetical protein
MSLMKAHIDRVELPLKGCPKFCVHHKSKSPVYLIKIVYQSVKADITHKL